MLIVHEEWLIFWKNRHRQGEGKSGTTEKLSSDDTPIAVLSATFTPLHATAYVTLRFVFALAHFKSMNSTYKSSMQNLVTLANHTRQATLTPHVSITHRKEHSTCFKTLSNGFRAARCLSGTGAKRAANGQPPIVAPQGCEEW